MGSPGERLSAWRARLPVVGVVVACVAGVIFAVTGAANPVSAVQFLLPGHWVYHAGLQSVFHVDGATATVDARARVPGDPGSQVVAGETSGYVVGDARITEFGKSSLSVAESTSPPSPEVPAGIETAGGPYLVYRAAGKVVRLGDPTAVISAGGPVGDPVATDDGTLWLPRVSSGLLCRLPTGAGRVSCPVLLPEGHKGALAVVGDRPVFVDTSADLLHPVEDDGLGTGRWLGVDVPDGARLASTDVAGRVAILDGNRMHLVDSGLDRARPAAKPVTVNLPEGDYSDPVSTGSAVAVVDHKTHTLSTYDSGGRRKHTTTMPKESGDPRLTRGEDDRVYVDGAEGEHVMVVDTDGEVTEVPITEEDGNKGREPQQEPAEEGPPAPPETDERTAPPVPEPEPQPEPAPAPAPQPEQKPEPPPQVPASPPGAPTGVSATAGNATATVNWGPAPDNRSAITGYTVSWPGGSTTVGAGARSATINGLANGTTYVFTVTATNGVGTGPGASSPPVTPVAPFRAASAPTNLTGDSDTAGSTISANWNAPADMGTGTFVHYLVEVVGFRQGTVTGTSVSYNMRLDHEVTINVTAVTAAPDGRQVPGATATVITGQPDTGPASVELSRGPATTEGCGPDPACAFMHVVLTGFPPNSRIVVDSHSTESGYTSQSQTFTTDSNGSAVGNAFPYAGVGEVVHVNAELDGELIRSNDVHWSAG